MFSLEMFKIESKQIIDICFHTFGKTVKTGNWCFILVILYKTIWHTLLSLQETQRYSFIDFTVHKVQWLV
jgi:hypothetical protein